MIRLADGERHLKVDIHTHILPEKMPRWAERYGPGPFIHLDHHAPCRARMMQGDKFFREIEDNCWAAEKRMQDCDRFDVDVQVLSTIPVLFYYWTDPKAGLDIARFLNDHIAETVRRYPKSFIGLGTVPMQDPQLAIREMERCVKELGLAGIEIGTHINDWNLNEEALFPFFEAAEKLGAAIFVHPWDMMGKEKMPKYWLPWLVGMPAETSLAICSMIFGGVLERLPDLRVAFAHGGGSFPATIGRINHGFDVRPDLCAIDNPIRPDHYLGRFWLDSLVHQPDMLKFLIDLVGEDKVALGTDYPFPLGELEPGKLIETHPGLTPGVQGKLLGLNALNWLNLSPENFL